MTNKYMYFIANWKMFGGLNSLNTIDTVSYTHLTLPTR